MPLGTFVITGDCANVAACRQRARVAVARKSNSMTVAEVASVFGKAGRAETATDAAPLEMF